MSGYETKFSSYSLSHLNELLEDDEKLGAIVQQMEEVQNVQQHKEMTLASNRSLAEQNLLIQPQLDCKKNSVMQRYRQLQEQFESYQLRKSTLDQNSGNGSLDTLLALLQAEGAKIEEETENMADSFLEGHVPLEAFVDEYQNKRKLAHVRRVKIDKMQEMVLKGHRLPTGPPVRAWLNETPSIQANVNGSPVPLPRRSLPGRNESTTPEVTPAPSVETPYLPAPYPPIPPRVINPSFPAQSVPFMPQYQPPLPQRPPPHMPPPGFIMQ